MYVLETPEHELLKKNYTDYELRSDNPNTSFPGLLTDEIRAEWGMVLAEVQEAPEYDHMTYRLVQLEPEYNEISGQWEVGYELEPLPEQEVLESKRRDLLSAVDYAYKTIVWRNIPYGNSAIQLRNETDEKLLMRKAMQAMNGNDATLILEDNSIVTIPAADFVALMTSLDAGIDQLKVAQRNIKNSIEAATTLADIESIDLGPFSG